MLARCSSASIQGMDAHPVTVEVDLAPGLPGLQLVGLPDAAIQESRERVRAALRNSGFRGPLVRVIVNLAPADLRKEGPAFDLPIAAGLTGCQRSAGSKQAGGTLLRRRTWPGRQLATMPRHSGDCLPSQDPASEGMCCAVGQRCRSISCGWTPSGLCQQSERTRRATTPWRQVQLFPTTHQESNHTRRTLQAHQRLQPQHLCIFSL